MLYNETHYTDTNDMLKYLSMDKQEFNDNVENGHIQVLTLGTYNGASDTFTPFGVDNEDIFIAIAMYLEETCQGTKKEDVENISQFVFINEETKEIYLKD